MKNEPAFTYNHIQEDQTSSTNYAHEEVESHPISLYLIMITDIILMAIIIFFTFRTIV